MEKNKKNNLDSKKIAVVALIVIVLILSLILIRKVNDENRKPVSELIELKNITKEENKILLNYDAYEKFMKSNKIEGNLSKKDFRTSNYVVLLGNFSKDNKITDVSITSTKGIDVVMEISDSKKSKLAYFIPVPKNKEISGLDVTINGEK